MSDNERISNDELLALLDRYHGNPEPDRRHERHVPCPWCRVAPKERQVHFSYGPGANSRCFGGGKCWVCHAGGNLWKVAARLGLTDGIAPEPRPAKREPPPPPPPPREWQKAPERWLDAYTTNARRYWLWQRHKPLSQQTIERWQLGVGVLPSCSCRHERLIVPLVQGGEVVGFRGRAIGCDCTKWLVAAGSAKLAYGAAALRPGQIVWIVENNVDALLLMQEHPDWCALASTNGAGYWQDEWTAQLVASRPRAVIVALDNDIAGQARGATLQRLAREWREAHPEATRLPTQHGPRLLRRLQAAGLPARLYQYPPGAPAKASVVDLMQHREEAA